jgi:hypothetical protein
LLNSFTTRLIRLEDVEKYYSSTSTSTSTGSQDSWDTALKWLQKCSSEHSECFIPEEPLWYPTRLLDIGFNASDPVKVVTTANIQPKGGYVTLSHRWGDALIVKLTKSSAPGLISGVSLSTLPLSYQQAAEVARRLQKRYIWIDSLCIFQDEDDKSDWLREAGLMDKVYSNSFLNIAATGAQDNSHGLFMSRDPNYELNQIGISCSTTLTNSREPGPAQDFIMSNILFIERELMGAPLNRRGWVLQERLLSPRVLHFGSGQLFWECRRGVLCERFPDSLPDWMARLTSTKFKSFDMANRKSNKPGLMISEVPQGKNSDLVIFHLWSSVVRAYSETQLTFNSDKAIALSGIAKVMRDTFKDEYVAGLWRRCLEAQLLWSVDHTSQADFRPSTRSFPYRAPTWSWLSVDGKINPGKCLRDGVCVEVLELDLKHCNEDTTGLIVDGSLKLKGRLRRLQIRTLVLPVEEGVNVDMPGMWMLSVGGTDLESSREGLKPWERIAIVLELDVPHADFHESNRLQELFIISMGGPWGTADDPFTNGDVSPWHDMLLLQCVDKEDGVFHRFGLAKLNTEDKPDVWSLVQAYDADEAELPCVNYDAETHSHTIILK